MINRDAFLATLKGCPVSVYLCFVIYGQRAALRPTFIARKTRYSRPAVYEALYFLNAHGLVQELPQVGWVATEFLRQQTMDLLAAESVNSVYTLSTEFTVPSSSSDLITTRMDLTTTTGPESVNSVDTPHCAGQDPSEITALCEKYGVFSGQAKALAEDSWVTVERVERWAAALRRDQGVRRVAAVLCSNLRNHREPPADDGEACGYLNDGGFPAANVVCPRCQARPCMCEEEA